MDKKHFVRHYFGAHELTAPAHAVYLSSSLIFGTYGAAGSYYCCLSPGQDPFYVGTLDDVEQLLLEYGGFTDEEHPRKEKKNDEL